MDSASRISARKPQWRKSIEIPKHRCEYNTKMDLEETGCVLDLVNSR
jgi:hypothetical protein